MPTIDELRMPLFIVGCVWITRRRAPPSNMDIIKMLKVFDFYKDYDDVLRTAPWMAVQISKLIHGLKFRYTKMPHPREAFDDAKQSCELIAGIWYMTQDKPAIESEFSDHVQAFLPRLDPFEVAMHSSWICKDMMPAIYEWRGKIRVEIPGEPRVMTTEDGFTVGTHPKTKRRAPNHKRGGK